MTKMIVDRVSEFQKRLEKEKEKVVEVDRTVKQEERW